MLDLLTDPDSGRWLTLSETSRSLGGDGLTAGGPGLSSTVAVTVVSLPDLSLSPTVIGRVVVRAAVALFWSAACASRAEQFANSFSVELVTSAFLRDVQTRPRLLAWLADLTTSTTMR